MYLLQITVKSISCNNTINEVQSIRKYCAYQKENAVILGYFRCIIDIAGKTEVTTEKIDLSLSPCSRLLDRQALSGAHLESFLPTDNYY